jgi:hypothetical protein
VQPAALQYPQVTGVTPVSWTAGLVMGMAIEFDYTSWQSMNWDPEKAVMDRRFPWEDWLVVSAQSRVALRCPVLGFVGKHFLPYPTVPEHE